LKIISFRVSGAFAAFRDPSVTSNQTVYFIPSKSAVIGFLGAMIGVERSSKLEEAYGKNYMEFFKQTRIGLQFETENPRKVTFFTNHRSLKEPKTKPYKTELVENPKYTIYVKTKEPYFSKLQTAIKKNDFVYSPYFGHAYCPATVSGLKILDAEIVEPEGKITKCIVLDESETYDISFNLQLRGQSNNSTLIIERHLYHFSTDEKLDKRVLKHWIPTNDSEFEIYSYSGGQLSEFVQINGKVVCLY
jgi:CRISPR-associated protein Cas5h